MQSHPIPLVLADSITQVPDHPRVPRIILCGSHGGRSSGIFALKKGVHAVIFNDAGVGKEQAGIASLSLLEKHGIYAATVDAQTARIGIAAETQEGIISFVNRLAGNAGVRVGMPAREAASILQKAPVLLLRISSEPPLEWKETLTVIHVSPKGYRIVAMDSNSQVTPENRKDIILTGSHGGLVGSAPVVKHPVLAAFYNDAGGGKEQAGISRLPRLQEAGILGATVDARTAQIGIGLETYEYGIISHVNPLARDWGILPGMAAKEAAGMILRRLEGG